MWIHNLAALSTIQTTVYSSKKQSVKRLYYVLCGQTTLAVEISTKVIDM